MSEEIRPEDLVNAYKAGLFPMADSREAAEVYWYDPPLRGQLSLPRLHIPRRLRRTVRHFPYEIRVDTAFPAVIDGCAEAGKGRPQSWINGTIRDLFIALHEQGHAHSVEAWHEGKLAGGIYGLALGGAFMGESMFSRRRDASKVALVHLCARLWQGGFVLFDTQFTNPHLEQFGVCEIPRAAYLKELHKALEIKGDFTISGQNERTLVLDYLSHSDREL